MFSTSLLNSILEPGSRTRHSMSFQPLSAGVTCTTAKSTTGTDKKKQQKKHLLDFFFFPRHSRISEILLVLEPPTQRCCGSDGCCSRWMEQPVGPRSGPACSSRLLLHRVTHVIRGLN